MSNEIDKASEEFVEALADVFEACKSGSASLELTSRLAKARANAKKWLSTSQYDEAVFKAARIVGWDWA
jgi:cytochrome c1